MQVCSGTTNTEMMLLLSGVWPHFLGWARLKASGSTLGLVMCSEGDELVTCNATFQNEDRILFIIPAFEKVNCDQSCGNYKQVTTEQTWSQKAGRAKIHFNKEWGQILLEILFYSNGFSWLLITEKHQGWKRSPRSSCPTFQWITTKDNKKCHMYLSQIFPSFPWGSKQQTQRWDEKAKFKLSLLPWRGTNWSLGGCSFALFFHSKFCSGSSFSFAFLIPGHYWWKRHI